MERDRFLSDLGFRILRIPGHAVIREDGDAITKIRGFVRESGETDAPSPPAPLPFVPQGRGEPELKSEPPTKAGRGDFQDEISTEMVAVLVTKTEAERLRIAWGMWRSARKMIERLVAAECSDLSPKERSQAVAKRMSHGT